MKRTDHNPIQFPRGLSRKDRQLCRKMIISVASIWAHPTIPSCRVLPAENVALACSGGIDSTVLLHAAHQAIRIEPYSYRSHYKSLINLLTVYINHKLRSKKELDKEIKHVRKISNNKAVILPAPIHANSGIQEKARDARLAKFINFVKTFSCEFILTAHTASDNAETKLFQFITGRKIVGIAKHVPLIENYHYMSRPFLKFTREDIERYAHCFDLTWCEDSSNFTDKYTRNKIRHHLIPWIKNNVNPGFEKIFRGDR